MQIVLLSSLVLLLKSCALGEAMSQTLGRPKRSFMVGFPAELSWLKGNEEVGRRDVGSGGDVWGARWGTFKGAMKRGSFLLIFLGQQKGRGLCLSWQTHLAGNCSDQTDNHSWKCLDKQKFTAPIGKVNRSRISPVHKQ